MEDRGRTCTLIERKNQESSLMYEMMDIMDKLEGNERIVKASEKTKMYRISQICRNNSSKLDNVTDIVRILSSCRK